MSFSVTNQYFLFIFISFFLVANCVQEKWDNLNELADVQKENEICCMCWNSDQQEKVFF